MMFMWETAFHMLPLVFTSNHSNHSLEHWFLTVRVIRKGSTSFSARLIHKSDDVPAATESLDTLNVAAKRTTAYRASEWTSLPFPYQSRTPPWKPRRRGTCCGLVTSKPLYNFLATLLGGAAVPNIYCTESFGSHTDIHMVYLT
jgi:hypothetical protein